MIDFLTVDEIQKNAARRNMNDGQRFKEIMKELQREWSDNNTLHGQRHNYAVGIRSSQISALVMLLIKKGVLP